MSGPIDLDPTSFLGRLIYRYYGTYSLDEATQKESLDRQEANDPDWSPGSKHTRTSLPDAHAEPLLKNSHAISKIRHAPLWSSLVQAVQDRTIVASNDTVTSDMYPSIVTAQQVETLDRQVASLLVLGERLRIRFLDHQQTVDGLLSNFICYVTSLWNLKGGRMANDDNTAQQSSCLFRIYNTVSQFTLDPVPVRQRVREIQGLVLCPPVPVKTDSRSSEPPVLLGECSMYSFAREYGLDPRLVLRRSPDQIFAIVSRCNNRVHTNTAMNEDQE